MSLHHPVVIKDTHSTPAPVQMIQQNPANAYLQDRVNLAPAAHTIKTNLALPQDAIAYQPCVHKVYL
jgi:hypothetical protein